MVDIRKVLIFLLFFAGFVVHLSCENDLEKIRNITSLEEFPDASGYNWETDYIDSFRIQVRILAPEIQRFARSDDPYIHFPKGMTAYFYNDSLKMSSIIGAEDVVYYDNEKLWEARNNVEARNLENGNQVNTEHMFWDEEKQEIYSNTNSRIVNQDGTFYGEQGFIAKQDMSWYRLYGSKGTVIVKDE